MRARLSDGTVPLVVAPALAAVAPLSDEDFDTLADLLDQHSPFDTDGVLGVLHAIAVAPSVLPPSAWLPLVLPSGFANTDVASQNQLVGLLIRLYNEVLDALRQQQVIIPSADDQPACKAFAAGYAAAAALDPLWIGDDDRWTFASCIAYLGDRLDLVPRNTLTKLQAFDDSKTTIRRDLAAVVAATNESFSAVRRAIAADARVTRVGRNEPCPCGSGKKYKRCCIDRSPGGPLT